MKFSGRTQMLSHKYSIFDIFKFFKATGFDGVELCFEDLNFNLRPDILDDYTIKYINELSKSNELEITAVGNHLKYFFDDYMYDFIKKSVKRTKEYGTDIFILSSMIDSTIKVNDLDIWKKSVERIKRIVQVAEDSGVKIAIEPEPTSMITDTKDFIKLCNDIGSDSLMCNFDIGHSFLTDDDIMDSIESIKDKIVHCHVEDIKKGEHIHLVPGRGDIDLSKVFKKLNDIEFDGGASLDLYHYEYDEVAEEALRVLHTINSNI